MDHCAQFHCSRSHHGGHFHHHGGIFTTMSMVVAAGMGWVPDFLARPVPAQLMVMEVTREWRSNLIFKLFPTRRPLLLVTKIHHNKKLGLTELHGQRIHIISNHCKQFHKAKTKVKIVSVLSSWRKATLVGGVGGVLVLVLVGGGWVMGLVATPSQATSLSIEPLPPLLLLLLRLRLLGKSSNF